MKETPTILAFAGSTRADSFNKKLVEIAAEGARRAGAEVTTVDLRDYALPLFDQDLEARDGLPQAALDLKELMARHDGLLIASPEYNSSVTGTLKNTIDWISRPAQPDEPSLASFKGKVAVLMSASPGGLGGLRGLVHLRAILSSIRVLVLPEQQAVPQAHVAFAPDGSLQEAARQEAVEGLGERLARVLAKLAS